MRCICHLLSVLMLALAAPGSPALAGDEAWTEIRKDVFGPGRIETDNGSVRLFGPKRAEDAALVPVTVYIAADLVPEAKRLVLVVDNNPAPVAATFDFAEAYRTGADIGDRTIETRIRLNSMSAVRAVVETADGKLLSGSQFIAGSGGCTSTSLKDLDEAMARLGQTRVAVMADRTRGPLWHELRLQIRHPNFSGMQMDALSGSYTPVHYVERIRIDAGGAPLMSIESGIAISEDPHFRLTFARTGESAVNVTVQDSKGTVFESAAAF